MSSILVLGLMCFLMFRSILSAVQSYKIARTFLPTIPVFAEKVQEIGCNIFSSRSIYGPGVQAYLLDALLATKEGLRIEYTVYSETVIAEDVMLAYMEEITAMHPKSKPGTRTSVGGKHIYIFKNREDYCLVVLHRAHLLYLTCDRYSEDSVKDFLKYAQVL